MQNTTDLWFSAFLMLNGHKPVKHEVVHRGKAKFYFNLSAQDWSQLRLEFLNSDISKVKQLIEQLKDTAY